MPMNGRLILLDCEVSSFAATITPHLEIRLRNGKGIIGLGKNIFCSINVGKTRGKRIFEIVHWPFELPPN